MSDQINIVGSIQSVTVNGQQVYPASGQPPVPTPKPPESFPYEPHTMPINGATGAAAIWAGLVQNITYAAPLNGTSGDISVTPEGGTPLMGPGANWEVSISKIPGDWATAKAMAATENPKDHSWNTPYYAAQGGQSGGLKWTTGAAGSNPVTPTVPAGEQWYFNLRITAGVTPTLNAIYVQPALAK